MGGLAARIPRMLVDTHAHLNSAEFDADLQEVLERAAAAGVGQLICIGYDLPSTERAIALADGDPRIYATAGLHPNSVSQAQTEWKSALERLAGHPRVVAIGETGLDYYRDWTPMDQQRDAFRWHLELADRAGLPVVVHNRESDDHVTATLRAWAERRLSRGAPGVLHSFCGGRAMMRDCAAAGYAISFSGMVTFRNRSLAHLADCAREAPAEAMLVETDCPYLAPVPHRGQRNEPAFVRAVAERVAALRALSMEEIERATTANARRVFPKLAVAEPQVEAWEAEGHRA